MKKKSDAFKDIFDEYTKTKSSVQNIYKQPTNEQELQLKKKTAIKNKKQNIILDERRHKLPNIKKSFINDNSITKKLLKLKLRKRKLI